MTGQGRVTVTVTVPAGTRARLQARVAGASACQPPASMEGTYRERRQARADALAERERRRESGQLLDTLTALISHHLREEMNRRRWGQEYEDPPEGWTSVPGRPRGPHLHQAPERLSVDLPAALMRRLHGAVYAHNRDAFDGGREPEVSAAEVIRAAVRAAAQDEEEGG